MLHMIYLKKIFKEEAKKCWFLLIMSFLAFLLLIILNIYIGLEIIQSFKGDGFSFLGGLIIGTSYLVTIPTLIFSILSIRMIRHNNSKYFIFPVFFGIIGVLSGIVLQNATGLWIYILIFSVLLLISCFICQRSKHKKNNNNI